MKSGSSLFENTSLFYRSESLCICIHAHFSHSRSFLSLSFFPLIAERGHVLCGLPLPRAQGDPERHLVVIREEAIAVLKGAWEHFPRQRKREREKPAIAAALRLCNVQL